MFKKQKAAPAIDPGLQLIDNYERAIVQTHLDRFTGHAPDVIEQERAIVGPLAARIGDALRQDYLARSLCHG